MQIDVDVSGLEETVKALEALPGVLGRRVQGDGLAAAARVVRDEAKTLVPVRAGALRDSIRARRRAQIVYTSRGRKRISGAAAQVVAGGEGAPHAMLVEYGTVGPSGAAKTLAQPYLEPAALNTRAKQLSAAAGAMRRAFARIGRQLATGTATATVRRFAAE